MDILSYLLGKKSSGGGGGTTTKPAPISISFQGSTEEEFDLSSISLKELTSSNYMFGSCTSANKIIINDMETTKLTNIDNMFRDCSKYSTKDIEIVAKLNTSNVVSMQNVFYNFGRNTNVSQTLDLKSWDVSKVTTTNAMFYYCEYLRTLDLSTWSPTSLTNAESMFYGCRRLAHLDIRNFVFDNISNYSSMFYSNQANCEIIVKDDTQKTWLTTNFSFLTNVKTVAEYEG